MTNADPRHRAIPPLDLVAFRGAVIGLVNYVDSQVHAALNTDDGDDRRYADRSVRHLLANLPSRTTIERLLDVVRLLTDPSGSAGKDAGSTYLSTTFE